MGNGDTTMSWEDFYRRRDALDAAERLASRDPEGPLPFAQVPHATEVFTGPAELLLALHYRWTMKLTGRLGMAVADAESDPSIDRVDAVRTAWLATAREFPVLRRLLDAHADDFDGALRPALAGEHRMLALASGLAEHGEDPEEITRIGQALLALIRTTPDHEPAPEPERRRNPIEQFLRKLVASV
ncbi:hypothetical protein EV186_104115 [Labedaea rhizosphaerae]|uniref:Uncharacterized protein n=2 Tax=Labedaea rhizosphaerae TaxID=598644 RepID=A0A4R6SB90_LABRH|nr:hypothetical protein EV186_104115 [Labedaea rhizosphaerae]